jgi:alanine racemase
MTVPSPGATSSRIELSASAWRANVEAFRGVVGPGRRVGAVLKGNAYGHGFAEVLPLAHGSVDALYVITPGEALAVRQFEAAHQRPRREVLVIGVVAPDELVELAAAGVDVVVADRSFEAALPLLRARGLTASAHVHLDTGLGREGFTAKQLEAGAADPLGAARDVLSVKGVLSHFANTEDVTEQSYAQAQLDTFERSVAVLSQRLGLAAGALTRHFAASAATLVLPASRYDVARVGIGLYGLWPSTETRDRKSTRLNSSHRLTSRMPSSA